jgi:hypothetical protein
MAARPSAVSDTRAAPVVPVAIARRLPGLNPIGERENPVMDAGLLRARLLSESIRLQRAALRR